MENKFYAVFSVNELEIITKTKEEAEDYVQMCDPYLYYIVPQTYGEFIELPEKKYEVPAAFWGIAEKELMEEFVDEYFEDI